MGNKTAGKALFLSLILSLLLVACGGPAPVTTDDDDRCQTYGYIPVCDLVLRYYRQHNGVELFGYPITRQMDRDGMRLQYFEKAIIQYPAVANPRYSQVSLRPLGFELSALTAPVTPEDDPDCRYFEPHGHLVCVNLLDFFDKVGGQDILGNPISESKVANGVLVQDFENARLKWTTDTSVPHVDLERWGEQACLADGEICADNKSPEQTRILSPTDIFVIEYGGESVFGSKVGTEESLAGKTFQCYQNACLVWNPNATEPVTLVPLGLQGAPSAPRIDPPPPSADVWYCPETGHSVILAFKDFYLHHGGEAVFGQPLTEFMREGERWVQWFENACFEWQPDRDDGERVQLIPLGEIHYRQFNAQVFQTTPSPDPVENEIVLTIRPDYTLLPPNVPQIIHLWAKDTVGRPLSGVAITFYLTTISTRQLVQIPPTNINGAALLRLDSIDAACGEIVRLRAVTKTANSTTQAESQFTFWCAPSSGATP